jgi:hypothetical protein
VGPSETFSFPAVIDSDAPCKVGFAYSVVRPPNPILRQLPAWLAKGLPWGKTNKVAMTDVINAPKELIEESARLRAAEADRREKRERVAREREQNRTAEWRPMQLPLSDLKMLSNP